MANQIKNTSTRTTPMVFVVFHPHKEPSYNRVRAKINVTIPWNVGGMHRRKFMCRDGEYLQGVATMQRKIYFWGEYEPKTLSVVIRNRHAKAIHTTLYPVRGTQPLPSNALNTDPYVFGNHFKYICCQMRKEEYIPGDMILFGNKRNANTPFLLDTVMIIKEKVRINHALNNTQYYKASIEPCNPRKDFYYKGFNFAEGEKYFSFVPCLIDKNTIMMLPSLDLTSMGFSLKKNFRSWKVSPIPFNYSLWNYVVKQVQQGGWEIGTHVNSI